MVCWAHSQVSVILLNLFTAVIIETFEKTHEQEDWKLSPQALEGNLLYKGHGGNCMHGQSRSGRLLCVHLCESASGRCQQIVGRCPSHGQKLELQVHAGCLFVTYGVRNMQLDVAAFKNGKHYQ